MKKITDEKEALEAIAEGHDISETTLVAEKLAAKKTVTFAASNYTHPLKGEPVLYAKGKSIMKETQAAIEEAREDVKEFKQKLTKAL